MNTKLFLFVFFALVTLLFFAGVNRNAEHPHHTVVCDFVINRETGMLEGTLRFAAEDVERSLTRRLHKRIVLEEINETPMRDLLLNYFQKKIVLSDFAGKKKIWEWVGHELDFPHIWFYIQTPVSNEEKKFEKIRISPFCEYNNEFHFIIHLREGEEELHALMQDCGEQHTH